jgi:hypothetical protein
MQVDLGGPYYSGDVTTEDDSEEWKDRHRHLLRFGVKPAWQGVSIYPEPGKNQGGSSSRSVQVHGDGPKPMEDCTEDIGLQSVKAKSGGKNPAGKRSDVGKGVRKPSPTQQKKDKKKREKEQIAKVVLKLKDMRSKAGILTPAQRKKQNESQLPVGVQVAMNINDYNTNEEIKDARRRNTVANNLAKNGGQGGWLPALQVGPQVVVGVVVPSVAVVPSVVAQVFAVAVVAPVAVVASAVKKEVAVAAPRKADHFSGCIDVGD